MTHVTGEARVSSNAEAEENAILRPRLTYKLFGHAEAELGVEIHGVL